MKSADFEGMEKKTNFLSKDRLAHDSVRSALRMSGSKFIAETFKGYGMTRVFFVEAILRRTLVEMEGLGIYRILAHTEKSVAYMANGNTRRCRKPGI